MIAEACRLLMVPFVLFRAESGKYPLLREILLNLLPNPFLTPLS